MTRNYTEFHDGWLEGFLMKDEAAHLFLADEKKKRSVIVAHSVITLRLDGAREGNIIFEVVERPCEETSESDIVAFFPDAAEAASLLERARARRLSLLEINPSYGGTCMVLAARFELMTRTEWLAREASSATPSSALPRSNPPGS